MINRKHLLQPSAHELRFLLPSLILCSNTAPPPGSNNLPPPSSSSSTHSSSNDSLHPALLDLNGSERARSCVSHSKSFLKEVRVAFEGCDEEGLGRRRKNGGIEEGRVGGPESVEEGGERGRGEREDLESRREEDEEVSERNRAREEEMNWTNLDGDGRQNDNESRVPLLRRASASVLEEVEESSEGEGRRRWCDSKSFSDLDLSLFSIFSLGILDDGRGNLLLEEPAHRELCENETKPIVSSNFKSETNGNDKARTHSSRTAAGVPTWLEEFLDRTRPNSSEG